VRLVACCNALAEGGLAFVRRGSSRTQMAVSSLAAAPPALACAPHTSRSRVPRLARAAPQQQPLSRALARRSRRACAGDAAAPRGRRLVCAAAEAPPPPPEKEASVEETTRKWGLEAGLWKVRVAVSGARCTPLQPRP
jgi:hypothetical protein